MMSSDFAWDVNRPERTQEMFERYDVQKAKQIIVAVPRAVEFIDLKKHGEVIKDYLDGVKMKHDVDWSIVDLHFARFPHTRLPKTPGKTRPVPNNARFRGSGDAFNNPPTLDFPGEPAVQRMRKSRKVQVDVSVPVIFARTKGGKFPIDGRHRLAKALNEGNETVPAIFLTEAETDSIRTTINLA